MSIRELRRLLADIEDTHELVLRGARSFGPGCEPDELRAAWAAARAEARVAYDAWRARGGAKPYVLYRAAADRADAAQDALAGAAESHPDRGLTSHNEPAQRLNYRSKEAE